MTRQKQDEACFLTGIPGVQPRYICASSSPVPFCHYHSADETPGEACSAAKHLEGYERGKASPSNGSRQTNASRDSQWSWTRRGTTSCETWWSDHVTASTSFHEHVQCGFINTVNSKLQVHINVSSQLYVHITVHSRFAQGGHALHSPCSLPRSVFLALPSRGGSTLALVAKLVHQPTQGCAPLAAAVV